MILSRIAKFAAPTALAFATGYYYGDDLRILADSVTSYSSTVSYFGQDDFPRRPWDRNWDHRDPLTLVDPDQYNKANEEDKKKMLEVHKPTATRNILLIRHGQYHLEKNPADRKLTELGRAQAALIGRRLAESDFKIDELVMSTMARATETALIVLEKLDSSVPSKSDSLLEEGAPYPPEPTAYHWRPTQRKFFTEGARIEAAFRKYIHRASVHQKEDSFDVLVCHGNVIRYFVCRALQFPPEGWLRMALGNASLTWIVVRPNGNVSIRAVGDIGHLHPKHITFS